MDKKRLERLERRLLEEREQVLKELGFFDENYHDTTRTASGDLSAYSFHMADQGTDAMEREKAFLFASQEGRQLYQIDEALRRLYRQPDGFGHCIQCSDPIRWERLEALPYATLCIVCKEREENGRGG
ncbi:MAG TPA: TraR/DksA family transcriptional regulator [Gemmatimonadota bacterium]|nr:TraR/DksA family transcriptional regulator [Gemmatimonadota bacterium]